MGRLTHTVSGDVASFRAASRTPIESLKFHFLPKQEGIGDPSPTNKREISGWTGLNGFQLQETLFKYKDLIVSAVGSDSQYEWVGEKLKISVKSGTSQYNVLHQISMRWDVPEIFRGKSIIFFTKGLSNSNENHHSVIIVELRRIDGTLISDPTVCSQSNNSFSRKVTLTSDTAYCIIIFRMNQGTTVTFTTDDYFTVDGFYANYPNVVTENPRYGFKTFPITFPITGKNLVNDEIIVSRGAPNNPSTIRNGNVYSNIRIDTRNEVHLYLQQIDKDGNILNTKVLYPGVLGKNSITFNSVSNCTRLLFKHNGASADIGIYIPWDGRVGTYTISANLTGIDVKTVGGFVFSDVQIELGDTATSYTPYSSNNIFYGGYIDPVAGEIVAEYIKRICDGSEKNSWSTSGTYTGLKRWILMTTIKPVNSSTSTVKYNYFKPSTSVAAWNAFVGSTGNFLFFVPEDIGTTKQDWCDYLEKNPLEICYQLAEPIHIPIPAQDLKAFLDHNNFWSDANGNTEVTYPITESKDILSARKIAEAFNARHYRKVNWNQLAPAINSPAWYAHSSDISTEQFDNGVATLTTIGETDQQYRHALVTRHSSNFWVIGHKYYLRQDVLLDQNGYCICVFGNEWGAQRYASANVWTTIIDAHITNTTSRNIFGLYPYGSLPIGTVRKVKNIMLFDLTQMFGEGNEPSASKFEHICAINDIDLTTYQSYDVGSDRWLIVP